jgi:hypothetical protein
MASIVAYFGRLKHWQMFLVIGLPFFAQQFYVWSLMSKLSKPPDIVEFEYIFSRSFMIGIIVFAVILAWLWSISVIANGRISAEIRPSMKTYKYVVPYTFLYLGFAGYFFPRLLTVEKPSVWIGIIVPLHLLATIGVIYALIFPARNLVMAERGKRIQFSGYFLTLFLLWIFPVGVWFIQPRLNALLDRRGNES